MAKLSGGKPLSLNRRAVDLPKGGEPETTLVTAGGVRQGKPLTGQAKHQGVRSLRSDGAPTKAFDSGRSPARRTGDAENKPKKTAAKKAEKEATRPAPLIETPVAWPEPETTDVAEEYSPGAAEEAGAVDAAPAESEAEEYAAVSSEEEYEMDAEEDGEEEDEVGEEDYEEDDEEDEGDGTYEAIGEEAAEAEEETEEETPAPRRRKKRRSTLLVDPAPATGNIRRL
ncbi:MAG: hypothetical protein ACOX8W_07610 [bacterium]|jgi:hypothetical protein